MASIDSRILTMKFDNKDFIQGVSTTISALGKLQGAMGFKNARSGVKDIQADVDKFNTSGMQSSVEGVSAKFIALSTVAITALANITNRAVTAGINIVKSLSLEQVAAGFQEYELNINSIQTIMANTAKEGTKLKDVNAALDELNTYSDDTIYNFAQMTQNIGRATAAGVKLDDAVSYVKGFANTAALAGASSTEMSGALEQMSQALGSGVIRLQDWMSLERRGIAGTLQQEAFFEMAKAAGTLADVPMDQSFEDWKKSGNSLRETLKDGWLTTDVFMDTMKLFGNELSAADLKAKGFGKDTIKQLLQLSQNAEDSATKVRTFSQFMDTAKEAVASGWSQTFRTVIGDFNQATELFTRVSEVFGRMIGRSSDARNDLLKGWAKLGGREQVIEGLFRIFRSFRAVLGTVSEAFREVFPKKTAEDLKGLSDGFENLTKRLKPSKETLETIGRVAKGVFSIFQLGVKAVKAIAGFFFDLGGIISKQFTGTSFLGAIANFADFFTNLNEGIPAFTLLSKVTEKAEGFLDGVSKALGRLAEYISPALDALKEFAGNVGEVLSSGFQDINWNTLFAGVGAGAAGSIALTFRKFFKKGVKFDIGSGFLEEITSVLDGLTGVLKGMQQNLQANALLKIAAAIGIISLSLLLLASIDPKRLTSAVTAIAVSMGILLGAMKILSKVAVSPGFGKITEITIGLAVLAGALLAMSLAIKILSTLSWEELAKGIGGLAAVLGLLYATLRLIPEKEIGKTAGALIVLGLALLLLTAPIKILSTMSWEELAKGFGGLAAALGLFIATIKLMPEKDILRTAGALAILGSAMLILSFAVKQFASMDLEELALGFGSVVAALGLMIGTVKLMPEKELIKSAFALVLVGVALNLIATAVSTFGNLSMADLAQGLGALAVALIAIALALIFMNGSIAGAFALGIAAAALSLLIPVLYSLALLSWDQIIRGLVALAGALTIIGIAAAIFGLAAPAIGLGALALLAFGVGLAAVGVAALLFAQAFKIAVEAASNGYEAMRDALQAVVEAIPEVIKAFGEGIVEFIKVIGNSSAEFAKAFGKIIGAMLDAVNKNIPKFVRLFRNMLNSGIDLIRDFFPRFLRLGFELLLDFLKGIRDNIPKIVPVVVGIITRFINSISDNLDRIIRAGANLIIKFINGVSDEFPRIINAGFRAVIKFLNGVADAIRNNSAQMRAAGGNIASAIVEGLTGGLSASSALNGVINAAKNLARSALNTVKGWLGIDSPSKEFMKVGLFINEGLAKGLKDNTKPVIDEAENVGAIALKSMGDSLKNIDKVISGDIKTQPVITPVLDLSQVRKDASSVGGIFSNTPVTASVSASQASTISQDREIAVDEAAAVAAGPIQFNQYNNSPKALSAIDIYRSTRNQLTLAKEELRP